MEYRKVNSSDIDDLWELQKQYKMEIGEDDKLIGCCSVTVGFSTFDYMPSGVFEDFYICPGYRHKGLARQLVQFAYRESGVSSLTVGCADCDVQMYQSLGFSIPLGNLLALE